MPNDAYQKRLEEWQKKERERRAAMEGPPLYDPSQMPSRVPLGCIMLILSGLISIGWLIWRHFKLHS